MGASPLTNPKQSLRKLPGTESAAPSRLDQYGRDPQSPSEQLRAQTNYDTDNGYSPLFHEMLADLPRLLGRSAAAWALVMTVLRLSAGRGYEIPANKQRFAWSTPLSLSDLQDLCRCDIRQLQRQIDELPKRGVMLKKTLGRGLYSFSLCYRSWRGLPDQAVWERSQVEPKPETPAEPEDETANEVSRDAVRLTKRPQTARPGRRLRMMKVDVGVRGVVCQNDDAGLNLTFDPVIEPGGIMVFSVRSGASLQVVSPEPAKPAPPVKPTKSAAALHPRALEVAGVFDPVLKHQGSPALSFDATALNSAAAEMREMPIEALEAFLNAPRGRDSHSSRASRPIKNGPACVAIVKECRLNWEARGSSAEDTAERDGLLKELGLPIWESIIGMTGRKAAMVDLRATLARSVADSDFTKGQQEAARRLLEILCQ